MRLRSKEALRNGASILTVGIVVTAIACSDIVQSPTPPTAQRAEGDFVAAGKLYNTFWAPSAAGLRQRAIMATPIQLSSTHGTVRTTAGVATLTTVDSTTAPILRLRESSFMRGLPSPNGSAASLVLRAKVVAKRTIDGRQIQVSAVPDDDKRSGRPPKAFITLVDGRIAVISERSYAKRSGAWRTIHSRTALIDATGSITLFAETDASQLVYQNAVGQVGGLDALRQRVGGFLPALVKLAQPDVLYAATPMQANEDCSNLIVAAAAAAANVALAGVAARAADIAVNAAELGLVAAAATCLESVAACASAWNAAIKVIEAAKMAQKAAYGYLGIAVLASAAADVAVSRCIDIKPEDETEIGPAGGGEGTSGCEEWCQWTISFGWNGERVSVHTDYCWCERGEDEL